MATPGIAAVVGVLRHRPTRLLAIATAVALPLALLPAGSGQAAPTLTIGQAQAQLAALQQREGGAVEAYDAGVIAAAAATRAAATASARVSRETAKLSGMNRQIRAFAAAAYTSGGLTGVDGLLAGGDPQMLLSRASSLDEIARTSSNQLLAETAEQQQLASLEQLATDKAADAARQTKALAAAKAQVQAVVAQEQQILDRLQSNQRAQLLASQAAAQAAASRAAQRAPIAPAFSGPIPSASGIAQIALQAAYSQEGKPYQYGGAGPDAYDCSGLTMWAFAHAGISLPHSAADQYGYGTHVPISQLEPGDLVFFDEGYGIGHVGIYVGNGDMIDANHSGGWVGVRPLYSGLIGGTRL